MRDRRLDLGTRTSDSLLATSKLVASLRDLERHPNSPGPISVIETHVSYVILTGSLAYKIKKPLRLAFLDFSTLALRRRACEDEVRLNRRTAPELYRRVVAITGTPDAPQLGGPGPAIEYAVEMRQFDPQALFATRLDRGDVDATLVDRLADEVARFHASLAGIAPEPNDEARRDRDEAATPLLESVVTAKRNFAEIVELAGTVAPATLDRLDRIGLWLETESRRIGPLLAERRRTGFVREGHGDLHLANVALVDGRPVLFDCLEFDLALRTLDVIDEVAFAFMDFEARARRDFAYRFLSRYLESTGDYAGVPALRFFAVHRALVRTKVALLRAHRPGLENDGRALAEAERYLTTAEAQTRPRPPQLVITCGLAGSGKTTVGGRLVETLGAIRLRSDVERKRLAGLDAGARSQSPLGGGLYSDEGSRRTYDRLDELARSLLGAGHRVLVDAAFLARRDRDRFRALACECSARFTIAYCDAPVETLLARVEARLAAGRDASEADRAVLEHQLGRFDRPAGVEVAETCVIRTDRSEADVSEACIAMARERSDPDPGSNPETA